MVIAINVHGRRSWGFDTVIGTSTTLGISIATLSRRLEDATALTLGRGPPLAIVAGGGVLFAIAVIAAAIDTSTSTDAAVLPMRRRRRFGKDRAALPHGEAGGPGRPGPIGRAEGEGQLLVVDDRIGGGRRTSCSGFTSCLAGRGSLLGHDGLELQFLSSSTDCPLIGQKQRSHAQRMTENASLAAWEKKIPLQSVR